MRKFLIVLLSVVMILQCSIMAGAVVHSDDPRYTVDLPEGFSEVEDNKFIWSDKSNFSVSFEDNTEEKFCVEDMNEKEVKSFVEEMTGALSGVVADVEIKVVSAEKIKHNNGKNALVIVLEQTYTNNKDKSATYQKLYMFSGEENIVTFAYTAKNKAQLDSFESAFASIVINESEIESNTDKLTSVALGVALVVVGIVGVAVFVKRRSR